MKSEGKYPRSTLATCSLFASLPGPVLTVLGILCLILASSLPPPARHNLAWVEVLLQVVAIPSLLFSPPLALVLGILALAKIRRSGGAIRGRAFARCGIIISALTLCFLIWGVPSFMTARRTSEADACGGTMKQLDSCKEQWAMSAGATNGPVDRKGVLSYRRNRIPICPGGGNYTLGDTEEMPLCSLHGTISNRYYPKWWE
jgi:hypothetical protein